MSSNSGFYESRQCIFIRPRGGGVHTNIKNKAHKCEWKKASGARGGVYQTWYGKEFSSKTWILVFVFADVLHLLFNVFFGVKLFCLDCCGAVCARWAGVWCVSCVCVSKPFKNLRKKNTFQNIPAGVETTRKPRWACSRRSSGGEISESISSLKIVDDLCEKNQF